MTIINKIEKQLLKLFPALAAGGILIVTVYAYLVLKDVTTSILAGLFLILILFFRSVEIAVLVFLLFTAALIFNLAGAKELYSAIDNYVFLCLVAFVIQYINENTK